MKFARLAQIWAAEGVGPWTSKSERRHRAWRGTNEAIRFKEIKGQQGEGVQEDPKDRSTEHSQREGMGKRRSRDVSLSPPTLGLAIEECRSKEAGGCMYWPRKNLSGPTVLSSDLSSSAQLVKVYTSQIWGTLGALHSHRASPGELLVPRHSSAEQEALSHQPSLWFVPPTRAS